MFSVNIEVLFASVYVGLGIVPYNIYTRYIEFVCVHILSYVLI